MRKIKEILRLHALGLSQRQIAVSCAIGQATVSEVPEGRRSRRTELAGDRRLGRGPVGRDGGPAAGKSRSTKPVHSSRTIRVSVINCKPIST